MASAQQVMAEEPNSRERGRKKRTYDEMQREHSRSDSKNQRLQWDTINAEGIIEPPRKRKKVNSEDKTQQDVVILNRSQPGTPLGDDDRAVHQEEISLDGSDI